MKSHHFWKPFAVVVIAMSLLGACADKDDIKTTGMIASKDGTPIRYQSQGEGETAIVFIHCWTCDHSFWNGQYHVLADKYKVVRMDLAGHGTSAGRKTYTMQSYGEDVVAVSRALRLERVVLVGHSMGGPVAVEAEKILGDKVIGVVGVDTFHTAFVYPKDEEGINNFVKPFIENFADTRKGMMHSMFAPGADPELVNKTSVAIPQSAEDMAVQSMYDIFRWSARENPVALDALGNKLRNINGNPDGKGEPLHDSVTLIPGTGHFPHMEKPAEFNTALRSIVEELDK